jgi:SAM-dependent methyltransferase
MDKQFWNERYASENYVYGTSPNEFFKHTLDKLSPGKLLLPAEGEGRNAVYAAKCGWQVYAYDQSEQGQKKAIRLAEKDSVRIDYQLFESNNLAYPKSEFDVIALIFAHFDAKNKSLIHQSLLPFLKPGGKIILEAFSKDHLNYNSINPSVGGPKDIDVLFSAEEIMRDFQSIKPELLEEAVINLSEGDFHRGRGSVIRFIGSK